MEPVTAQQLMDYIDKVVGTLKSELEENRLKDKKELEAQLLKVEEQRQNDMNKLNERLGKLEEHLSLPVSQHAEDSTAWTWLYKHKGIGSRYVKRKTE